MTRILKIEGGCGRPAVIEQAAQALADGGLCVFPTETVYGLAANGDIPEAVRRLDAVKQRPPGKPYTLMLASKEDLKNHVSKVPLIARNVIERFWPGPLTVVFGDEAGEGMGVRVPASETAREILRAANVPALVTSANVSGEQPAATGREAAESLDGLVDVIVDEGETPLKEPSTVVEFIEGKWHILREGLISESMIAKHAQATLLFVCAGNACRSPLAEVICKRLLARRLDCAYDQVDDLGYRVMSAGTSAAPGGAAAENARTVASEIGCDLTDHTTRPLTLQLVAEADLIYTMAADHLPDVIEMGGEGKTTRMGDADIPDPIGGDLEDYRECADEIEDDLMALLGKIL